MTQHNTSQFHPATTHLVLNEARALSRAMLSRLRDIPEPDDIQLLVADLLEAHADTGIELSTWPAALHVVLTHLACDPDGLALLRQSRELPWFTVVGTWREGFRESLCALPGRRTLPHAATCWTEQVQAWTVEEAMQIAQEARPPAASWVVTGQPRPA